MSPDSSYITNTTVHTVCAVVFVIFSPIVLLSFTAKLTFQFFVNKEMLYYLWNVGIVDDTVELVGFLANGKQWNESTRVVAACPRDKSLAVKVIDGFVGNPACKVVCHLYSLIGIVVAAWLNAYVLLYNFCNFAPGCHL